MPVVESEYNPPKFLQNGHIQSIFPALFRYLPKIKYERERIYTPDEDFLDLDWLKRKSKKLVILCHGLEGNSQKIYIKGAIKALQSFDCDFLCWNYRGCSGEPNNLLKYYHSGKTEDLSLVIEHVLNCMQYEEIFLLGFSVGGNIVLKYLGEKANELNPKIKKAVAISVPVSLECCARKLEKPRNIIYMKRFLHDLKKKILSKEHLFPAEISSKDYNKLKSFYDFDSKYTAPLNGFLSAEDYWNKASSINFLSKIKIPTLLLQALDDPFLGERCYPVEIANANPYLFLEMPKSGGHVGFITITNSKSYSEERIIDFFQLK